MRLLVFLLLALGVLAGCTRNAPPPQSTAAHSEEPAFSVNPKFSEGASVMQAARKVFPESAQISLLDFWTSADVTHEFVVFFAGRETKVGFESMYWRYLVFVKKKTDRDWANARVFDLPDNHPEPFSRSLAWLEANAQELNVPNQVPEPTSGLAPGRGSS